MAELRHLLVIVPCHAAETAPRPVVALTVLTCSTSLAVAFRLDLRHHRRRHRLVAGQSSQSFLGSQLDGGTTPVGCEFLLPCCVLWDDGLIKKMEISRDNAHGRIFQTELPDNQALTVENCIASCSSQGFSIAGLEYSVQCCKFDCCRLSMDQPLGQELLISLQSVVTISYKLPL